MTLHSTVLHSTAFLGIRLKLRLEAGELGKGRIGIGHFFSAFETFHRRPLALLAVSAMLRLAALPEALLLSGVRSFAGQIGCGRQSGCLGLRGIAVLRGFRRRRRWFYARLLGSAVWAGVRRDAGPRCGRDARPRSSPARLASCLLGWQCSLATIGRGCRRDRRCRLLRGLCRLCGRLQIGFAAVRRLSAGSFLARSRKGQAPKAHLPGRAVHFAESTGTAASSDESNAASNAVSDGASEATVSLGGCTAAGGGSDGFGRRSMR